MTLADWLGKKVCNNLVDWEVPGLDSLFVPFLYLPYPLLINYSKQNEMWSDL